MLTIFLNNMAMFIEKPFKNVHVGQGADELEQPSFLETSK